MTRLDKLERKYEELGAEIAKLKKRSVVFDIIKLPELPVSVKVHVAPGNMTWEEAMDYAEELGMRLPTKFELQAIAESTDSYNYLGYAWSSSMLSYNTSNAWYVYLSNGFTNNNSKTDSRSVLCVVP